MPTGSDLTATIDPGAARQPAAAERRCLVTREVRPRDHLVRFVRGPAGQVLPDVGARLPGRGMWLSAERNVVDKAVARNLFARAAAAPVQVDPDLAGQVERLLVRRALDTLGLARRAGKLVAGHDQVRACLRQGGAAVLIEAADGALDGRQKLRRLGEGLPVISVFDRAELGAAVGRDDLVHAALLPGRLAERLLCDTARLAGFRPAGPQAVACGAPFRSKDTV